MKIVSLTPTEIRLIDTLLGLDFGAVGLSQHSERIAVGLRKKLTSAPEKDTEVFETPASRPLPRQVASLDPLRVLRLTPSFRHEDK